MTKKSLLSEIKKDIKVSGISSDTRNIEKNNIFFAVPGNLDDGHHYIATAIKKKASAIVTNKNYSKKSSIPIYKIKDIREELSRSAYSYYANNISNLVAVTGTNGKTSVSFFIHYLLSNLKEKSGLISTVGSSINKFLDTSLTTPDPVTLAKILKKMSNRKIDYVVMEASSHGLDQKRLETLLFDICILTNITHDHLDYHRTKKNYIDSKLRLFINHLKKNGKGIININNLKDKNIKKKIEKLEKDIIYFGNKKCDFQITDIKVHKNLSIASILYKKKKFKFKFKDFPLFQIENALLAVLSLLMLGFKIEKLQKLTSRLPGVPGRMQLAGKKKSGARIFIDFAHTPDALERVMIEAKKMTDGKLHILFGCGGDRDKKKRSVMGKIASEYSDHVIVTDDNPRFENPSKIRKEIIGKNKNFINFSCRKKAIEYGIKSLAKNDILIIAGKGHEKFQIIKDKYYKFDDYKIAMKYCL